MVFVPTFADLDSEREVVLEEIAMVEDSPQELVHDLVAEAIFPGHPLGRPVIGRAEVISSVTRRTIAGYHRRCTAAGTSSSPPPGIVDQRPLVELIQRAASTPGGVRAAPRTCAARS